MVYILFKNLNNKEIDKVINFLEESGYTNSHYGPKKDEAIGVCTTTLTQNYTYLSEAMCCTNPNASWITSRKEYTTISDFEDAVNKQLEIYEEVYPKLKEQGYYNG